MGLLRTILLGLLALVTVIFAVMETRDGTLSRLLGRGTFAEGTNLFSFNPHKAQYFFLRTSDKEAKFHKKDNGVWWAEAPWNDRMDPRAAEAMLQFAIGTRVVDVLPMNNTVKGNMREFGVENSPVEILIKDKRERSLSRFKLGNAAPWILPPKKEKEPVTPTVYLKTDLYRWDPELFVVSGNISPLFKDGLRYLRDHRPLYFDPSELTRIDIKTEGTDLTLERKSEKDPWSITKPIPLEADQAIVTNLMAVLQQLTAIKVSDPDDMTIQEKESPKNRKVTLTFNNDQPPVTLTILPKDKNDSETELAFVSDRAALFSLPVKMVDQMPGTQNLALSQKFLRSKKLASIDIAKLNAIAMRTPASPVPLRLVKAGKENWVYSADGDSFTPINEIQLYTLLKTLSTAPVADFATDAAVDTEPYGLAGEALYTLTFGFDGKDPLRIRIGQGIDDKYYAMVDDKPSVLTLSPEYIKQLGLQPYMWKLLNIFDNLSPSDVKSISLTLPNKDALKLNYNFKDDDWTVTNNGKDITPQINVHKASNYLDSLAKAQVQQWLPAGNATAREALKNPSVILSIEKEMDIPTPGMDTYTETIILAPAFKTGNSRIYFGQKEGDSDYFMIDELQYLHLFPNILESSDDDR